MEVRCKKCGMYLGESVDGSLPWFKIEELKQKINDIIEKWYQEHSISYLGKRDCVCEIDRDSVNKLIQEIWK